MAPLFSFTSILNIIAWLFFGALAGWLAGKIARFPLNFTWSVIVGISGSLIGGLVLYLLNLPFKIYGFDWLSLLTAIIGSILLLAVVSIFIKPNAKK
jgi:uncharacterized membrane protein YeaQ/YmgE (transglycosylase-associated protein family)